MFERGKIETGTGEAVSGVSVVLSLTDGTELKGRLAVPQGRSLVDALNGSAPFVEFETFDGPRQFLAKHAISGVRLMSPARAQGLARLRDSDGFDPYAILGLPAGAPYEAVRAAYLRKAKDYHPDRYANAELPEEVRAYLAAMARRINAAFAALEAPHQESRQRPVQRITPIYSSPAR
ncbi:MAG: DnaJ family molecular chaperone [Hyphomicrobiaceae bacterium]